MNWEAVPADPRRIAFGKAAVRIAARVGWNESALAAASQESLGTPDAWQGLFPSGRTEALWFVSDISDASMALPFRSRPAFGLSEVIAVRLRQNALLKPFVRQVMKYDFLHGWQAFARMQRTAEVMLKCVPGAAGTIWLRRATLNLVYTYIVFRWLNDHSPGDERTIALTGRLMRHFRLG